MFWLKLLIVALIVVFVIKTVRDEQSKFAETDFTIRNIQWPWLLLASISYLLGMLPMGLNWHLLLSAMQNRVLPRRDAIRTHYISQLGKYVPGKAVVVAIRLGLLAPYKIHGPTTFVSIVAETLTQMSVGAVIAASVIAVLFRSRPDIALAAVGMALVAGLPVIPPVLRFGLRLVQQRKAPANGEPVDAELSQKLTWKVVLPGWLGVVPGWFLMGLSVWAVMKAMNVTETRDMTLWDLPWVTATYAISVVAGFLSMLPSGVFVRETVMKEMIEPQFGTVVALIAPVIHRLVCVTSELLFCGMLYLTRKEPPAADAPD